LEQPAQKAFVDPAAEALATVDLDDRNAMVVALAQVRIGIDIDLFDLETVFYEDGLGHFAQVATRTRIQSSDRNRHGRLLRLWPSPPSRDAQVGSLSNGESKRNDRKKLTGPAAMAFD
jgi:hypothetical protein